MIQDAPYALLAHSMGGLIGMHGILKGKLHPKAAVLSSPLLAMPEKPVTPKLARPIAKVLNLSLIHI